MTHSPKPPRGNPLRRTVACLALAAALNGAAPAIAEPAEVPPAFTLAQLLTKLESRFYEIEPGAGSLLSTDGLTSDLVAATNRSGVLETLGPPDAVRRFAYSYNPDIIGERPQNRHRAGMLLQNALPAWRDSRKWVGRALIEAEKTVGPHEISETAEGYWITVSNPQGRVILEVSQLATIDTDVDSLGVSLDQVLAGLAHAFPQRDEGMGTLFSGPGSISDRFFSDNVHATLETLGPSEDLIGLRYLYDLRDDDHQEATRDNRSYAFALVRNVFPDWAEADAWMQAAIEAAERTADTLAEPQVIDHGPIRLQLRYFVGATEAIDIMIFPRNTQI